MTLFESNSEYRENAALWRVFSYLPLQTGLLKGHVWNWFAVNIPMRIVGNKQFTSDIDIIASLQEYPPSNKTLYVTWEAKVCLLTRAGKVLSLKRGKTKDVLKQVRAYRRFGAPRVSLLDICICQDGFMRTSLFPMDFCAVMAEKANALGPEGFGHQMLAFEHETRDGYDFGLKLIRRSPNLLETTLNFRSAKVTQTGTDFQKLACKLEGFFDGITDQPDKVARQIVYCRKCNSLQLVRMLTDYDCPQCGDCLITQH